MVTERPDVLVIGGGIVGVCSAYYAAKAGLQVTLLEKGELASGCSHGNAGLIVPSHCVPMAAPGALAQGLKWLLDPGSPFYVKPRLDRDLLRWLWLFRAAGREAPMRRAMPLLRDLQRESLAQYKRLMVDNDEQCDFGQDGNLILYRSQAAFQKAVEETQLLAGIGVNAKVLDMEGVLAKEPAASPELCGGVLFEEDGHIDPVCFTRGLAKRAEAFGARFQTKTTVKEFSVERDRMAMVRTDQGAYRSSQVVLATGSWTPALGRALGLRLAIQPAKGYSITMVRPADGPKMPLMFGEARVAVTPFGERIRFAGTLELAGHNMAISQRRVQAIMQARKAYLGDMAETPILETWAGLRPATPDGLPIIGRPGALNNVVIAAGHGMLGVSMGPVTGMLVGQMLAGIEPDIDLTLLGPDRF